MLDKNNIKIFISAGHFPEEDGYYNRDLRLSEHAEAVKVVDNLITIVDSNRDILNIDIVRVPAKNLVEKVKFINARSLDNDLAIEVHFNAFEQGSAQGFEVLEYKENLKLNFAEYMLYSMTNTLPFKSRGIKYRKNLYLLHRTKIKSVIVEFLFLDNKLEASYLFHPNAHNILALSIYYALLSYINKEDRRYY